MAKEMTPAEVFRPGEFIAEEIEARAWKQEDLAAILGRPLKTVNEIIAGKKQITPATAVELAQAFGTSPEIWLNLESAYRLAAVPRRDHSVARRSRLYSQLPVRELIKRGWIRGVSDGDFDALERSVCEFLSVESIEQKPAISFAARVASSAPEERRSQMAWVCRVRNLASAMTVGTYSAKSLRDASRWLAKHSVDEDKLTRLPETLARLGVRLLFVPHLRSSKIDGAALWLNAASPVIALSLRHDRVDYFWFTLMHELAHVVCRHGNRANIVDNSLVGDHQEDASDKRSGEIEADRLAADWLIPPASLNDFIGRVRGNRKYFSATAIKGFASALEVHPGIVAGRLQFEREAPYSHFRGLLSRVRDIIRRAGLFDTVPASLRKAK